jgi:23S rRNA pseudouridine2605 synthase
MWEKMGYSVLKLTRTRLGGLSLGRLKPGEYRALRPTEVEKLKRMTEGEKPQGARAQGVKTPE